MVLKRNLNLQLITENFTAQEEEDGGAHHQLMQWFILEDMLTTMICGDKWEMKVGLMKMFCHILNKLNLLMAKEIKIFMASKVLFM